MDKKHAWMRLTEHHMPHMKGMELGKKYHVAMEIEPTELSTGESEYEPFMGPDGKKGDKPPMTGRFKVHSITEHSGVSKAPHTGKQAPKKGGAATGRYA